ncbi:MAG: hypothetical protein JRJ24_14200 [Deltaproteobacteria bacterium]|nr:hypothetical protein [Deltaproteobacteria bacterium]
MTRPTVFAGLLSPIQTLSTALSFVLVTSLMLTQNAAAQKLEDGAFDPEDWTDRGPFILPDDVPGGAVDWSQLTTGGNPDHHLRFLIEGVSVPLGESSQAWGLLINENEQAIYDPMSAGLIERIDFEFDARLPPDDIRGNRAVSLALEQDGFLWAAIDTRVFVDESGWTPKGMFGLTESDFTPFIWAERGQPSTPDFSFGGSPIAFGLVQGVSCPTTSDCSLTPVPNEVDIDNWTVAVNQTGVQLTLSVDEVSGPGRLPELDLELLVTARVYNAGPSEVSDVTVRFHLPKEHLAGFFIPDTTEPNATCRVGDEMGVPISAEFVIADCEIIGPLGTGTSDIVTVPISGISAGYAGTVPDGSTFTYAAGVLPFSGSDPDDPDLPDPANSDADEVDVVICNPTGIAPRAVDDIMRCDDLGTGGTSGAGGTAGTGGGASMGNGGGGCSAATAANGSNPWISILCLAGVAMWLRRRRRG